MTKTRKDLIKHLEAGFIIEQVANASIMWGFPIYTGLVAATVAGLGKELVYDTWYKKTGFDLADFFCTFIGGFMGLWLDVVKF
jgi:hypothetical protein